jgi:hypothetical protein
MSEWGNRPEAVTSPAPDMEPFEDESEIFGGDAESAGRHADEEEDGEELFGDNMEA